MAFPLQFFSSFETVDILMNVKMSCDGYPLAFREIFNRKDD